MSQHDTQTVLILGANSFSGQDFVDLLLENPRYRVIGVSRSPERSSLFLKYRSRADLTRYEYHTIDMNQNLDDLIDLLATTQPTAIVNFAALSEVAPSWEYPEDWFQTNCVAFARLLKHLSRFDFLQRYLHISSPEVYGSCVGQVTEDAPLNPSTPYAVSKATADLLLDAYRKQFAFPVLWVRATNVYGARQQLFKIIPRSAIYALLTRPIELHGGGRAIKSYIHIRDVSRGELAVLERGQIGHKYHLSPDHGFSVREIVERILRFIPVDPSELIRSVNERPGQDAAYVIDSSKARLELGWSPSIALDDGLREVVDWVRENLNEIRTLPLIYEHQR